AVECCAGKCNGHGSAARCSDAPLSLGTDGAVQRACCLRAVAAACPAASGPRRIVLSSHGGALRRLAGTGNALREEGWSDLQCGAGDRPARPSGRPLPEDVSLSAL